MSGLIAQYGLLLEGLSGAPGGPDLVDYADCTLITNLTVDATDWSTKTNHLTAHGSPTFNSSGIVLTGSEYLDADPQTYWNWDSTGGFLAEFKQIVFTDAAEMYFFCQRDSGHPLQLVRKNNGDQSLQVICTDGSGTTLISVLTQANPVTINVPFDVAFKRRPSDGHVQIFVNGVEALYQPGAVQASGAITDPVNHLTLFAQGGGVDALWKGSCQGVRFVSGADIDGTATMPYPFPES